MISTFLYRHSVRSISRTSVFTFPYSTFRRYFGINTIWYWHFHLVCDKLFSSIRGCLLWYFLVLAFDTATIIPLEAFAIFYTTVYSILPSLAGGLSLSIIADLPFFNAQIMYSKGRFVIILKLFLWIEPVHARMSCPSHYQCRLRRQK